MSRNFELLSEAGRLHELVQNQMEPTQAQQGTMEAPFSVGRVLGDTLSAVPPIEENVPAAVPLETNPAAKQEIVKLVQKLFLSPQGVRRVVFSGTEPGCGCSWMLARVAEELASQGRGTVCVVDCNLRSPGLHEQFGMQNHHGLSDALSGPGPIREYVHRWSNNLWMVSCGGSPESGVGMLGSERMRARMAELRMTFDFVLVDAAPLGKCNDAIVLAALNDGVVLVLKANASRRETARNALYELQTANVNVLGAVLNQRTFPIPQSLYKKL
ncbi:MAG TPA: CpsD/CapB family tyrosine-protein kinase [Candidatus Eisenbacteria bacterium]|nr:CpsD/CapB family tyrosine-protein kinase [Candidatus Eisenbacteria bacterium]